MPMTARSTLQTLQKLVDRLSRSDEHECTVLCVTIAQILRELKAWAESSEDAKSNHPCSGAASVYIAEMNGPLNSIAGLYDYGHDKEQCMAWLRSGIQKLASVHCFGVKLRRGGLSNGQNKCPWDRNFLLPAE